MIERGEPTRSPLFFNFLYIIGFFRIRASLSESKNWNIMRTFAYYLVIFFLLLAPGLRSQTAPVTTAGSIINATTAPGAVVVPITVKNFVSIGSFTLTLRYKSTLVTYISAAPHSSFPGMTVVNTVTGTIGKIVITWPQTPGGVTLPDETHLLDLTFTYLSSTSALAWSYTSGNVCQYQKYSGGSYILLTDSPKSSYYINGGISNRSAPVTFAPVINNPVPGNLSVPITVNNFTAIGAMTLTLEFNQAVLNYQNCTPNPSMLANFVAGTSIGPNGKMLLTMSWYGNLSLANGNTVATINFIYSNTSGSYSSLDWYDTGSSCEYADVLANPLLDTPTADYYKNGAVCTQYAPRVWLPLKTNEIPSHEISLPIFANNFTNVRSFNLSFEYDGAVVTYGSFTPDAAFGSALTVTDSPSGSKRKIVMTWTGTTNKTLPDGSLLGTVNFTYASGTSALAWITSDATSCRFNDANGNAMFDVPKATYYQDGLVGSHVAPIAAAGQVSGTLGQPVTIPLKVYNYDNIGQFAYAIDYDPAVLTWQSGSLVPALGGTFSASVSGVGRVIINWSGTAGPLADGSTLVNLTFTYNGGASPVAFFDDGNSSRYAESVAGPSLYDIPRSSYYINGYVGPNPLAADFTASGTYGTIATTFVLTDATTGSPTAWNWSISPSTYYFTNGTSASSQNPQIRFTANNAYSVALISTRGTSSSIKIKKDYIFVGSRVFLNCPNDQTVAACQTQSAINTAYATWLASATSTCSCNCVLTNNSTGPPPACGGSSTVTWTLASDCETTVTCTKTFTVTAAPAVVFTCASDKTEAACQSQAAIDASFAAWLLTTTASGGCSGSLTTVPAAPATPSASGGSTIVTWNYTSLCDVTQTCTRTYTVDAAQAIVFNCASDKTEVACQSQGTINTSFAAWLLTTTASGGCGGVLTTVPAIPVAPAACGGSTTVTWNYTTSTAPYTTTCTRTFIVDPAPAVAFNCATAKTEAACQTQDAINTSFAAWLLTTTASGGCNGTLTTEPSTPVAPDACGGATTVTWNYISSCDVLKTCTRTFTVDPAPAVVFNCPVDKTEAACQTQGAIDASFTSWLATASASGGCNGSYTRTPAFPTAPPACGGFTDVTWTYTSSCDEPKTCTKRFTVNAAPAVTFTCGNEKTESACQSQSVIDASFNAWLLTTTASGGCNGVMSTIPVTPVAPNACGGPTTVTWNYASSCEVTKTCTKTFTVLPAPAVIFNCPTDKTEAACQPQETINASFTAWLGTADASGGCNGSYTRTPAFPTAPPACGGFTDVTWTYTSSCDEPKTCTKKFSVNAAPAVTFTCGNEKTETACQSQSVIDASFSAWLLTTTASGGCNGVMSTIPVTPVAPNACGGSTTVTWNYISFCEVTKTCTKTFTVLPAPAVIFNCPDDKTEAACQPQEAIDDSFTAWLATASASGGCNGLYTRTPAFPTAPPACGGFTDVTWTYTSSCDEPKTCTKRFTVNAAPAVTFTCAADKTEPACQSQTDIDASFADWLTSISVSGGCNGTGTRTPDFPVAPLACGGFTEVTWTYTSSCEVSKTCTRRFTVTASPAVLTCPTDYIMSTGQSQAVVDAAYAGWLGSVTASGGCNATLTNDGSGAPPAGGGSVTVTWSHTSSCAPLTTSCSATFMVAETNSISGTLTYNNLDKTPMNDVTIRIQKFTSPKVDKIYTTHADGSYAFGNLCAGTYAISPEITLPTDEINSTDAALVNVWSTTTGITEFVTFLAGDVAGYDSFINSTDALRIQRHFVFGNPFDKDPWSTWKKGITINSNWDPAIKPTDFDVTISGADVMNYDLYTQCTGDFNSSYTPGVKSTNSEISLIVRQTRLAGPAENLELPVSMINASTVGAVSLILNFPSDLMEISGVTMKENDGQLDWSVRDNELRIGWYSMHPMAFESNEDLLVIHLKTSDTFSQGDLIRIQLAASRLNELADGNFKVIPDAELGIDLLGFSTNGIGYPPLGNPLTVTTSPNPFANYTIISYTLPAAGKVTLQAKDLLGRTVTWLVNEFESSGKHSVTLDALSLQPGVYFATIKLVYGGGEMFKTIKLVRNR